MANPNSPPTAVSDDSPSSADLLADDEDATDTACVLCFNAADATGAAGLSADMLAIACVGAHPLPVTTGAYARDTAQVFDHFPFDDEAVSEQARYVLEDVSISAIKAGFLGTPENIAVVAQVASDYDDVPLLAYMPNLSWWQDNLIDSYLDAFAQLLLPQTTVLVGNHSTLWRWLLPDWTADRSPTARDIARAAYEHGVPYTLVTGIPLPEQHIDNVLATPEAVLASRKFERFEATFVGAGETLSAALIALIASGTDLVAATEEALAYLDRCLDAGFRPGMGHIVPDRLFWAQPPSEEDELSPEELRALQTLEMQASETRH